MKWHRLSGDDQDYRFLMAGEPGSKPLIFLHGYNLDPERFLPFARRFLEYNIQGYGQVIIPNIRDHSKRRPRPLTSTDEYLLFMTDFVGRFLEGEEEEPYALGGHSYGGHLATWLSWLFKDHPPEEVFLVNPAMQREYSKSGYVGRALVGHAEESLLARSLSSTLGGNVAFTTYVASSLYHFQRLKSGLEDITRLSMPPEKMSGRLHALLSEQDRIFNYTTRDVEMLAYHFPQHDIQLVPNTHHNLPLRKPGLTARLLCQYEREMDYQAA